MTPLRIAHIVPTYLPATRYGGPIYSVHGLCRGLASLGHDVQVFTTSVDGPNDSDVPHGVPVTMDGVRVRYYRSRQLRRLYWSPPLGRGLAEALADIDIVHLHSVFLWPTNAAARSCNKLGVPYVLSPRGMLVKELIEQKNRLIKTAWLRLIEDFTVHHAACMHYTSAREQVEAQQVYSKLPPACVLSNGVDVPESVSVDDASAHVKSVLEAGPYVFFLGRVHWVKGIDRLLRSIAGTQMRLVICGNDEEGYAPQVQALIDSLQLARQVTRLPPVHGNDKWALIRGARLLVLPSISENFGNVVPEAMAMGCPVVTTRGVGASEIVERSGGGIVCDHDDAALRDALLALWQSDELRASMSKAAHAFVQDQLLWPQVAQGMVECYAQAIERSRARTSK